VSTAVEIKHYPGIADGPIGADRIEYVAKDATPSPATPIGAYPGIAGGPVGSDRIRCLFHGNAGKPATLAADSNLSKPIVAIASPSRQWGRKGTAARAPPLRAVSERRLMALGYPLAEVAHFRSPRAVKGALCTDGCAVRVLRKRSPLRTPAQSEREKTCSSQRSAATAGSELPSGHGSVDSGCNWKFSCDLTGHRAHGRLPLRTGLL